MISMHNVGSAGQALHYFSQDNYYSEHQGLEESAWWGAGAHRLGLAGQVDREHFFELLDGRVGDQVLGRQVAGEQGLKREHRPGTDITFSAPKSVSILAEVLGSKEVRQAHEAAVREALKHLERELASARQGQGGEVHSVKTEEVVVALFRHNTSRELDPQTHTHALVLNATWRPDGVWRSLDNEPLYKGLKDIDAVYTAELAHRLRQLGYGIRRTDERGNFEVQGISREQIEVFSRRRAEIADALALRGKDIASASREEREKATLMTRAHKAAVDHVALRAQWRQQAAALGLDERTLQGLREPAAAAKSAGSKARLSGTEAVAFAAAHLGEREAVVARSELYRVALQHGVGQVSPAEVRRAQKRMEAQGQLVRIGDEQVTTRRMLGSERWALAQIQATRGQGRRILGEGTVQERLQAIERRQGFALSSGQRDAVSLGLASHDRFTAIQGLAGTGKTTMLRALRELAEQEGYVVQGMAPTGSAAKTLQREAGIASQTVHMFAIRERNLARQIEALRPQGTRFERRKELWVVDESSFLSQTAMARLMALANRAEAKVLFMGDRLQLQGVEAGKPFELAQDHGMATARMSQINRQRTADLQAVVQVMVGQAEKAEDVVDRPMTMLAHAAAFDQMDRRGMVVEAKGAKAVQEVVQAFTALSAEERRQTVIVTAYNQDREAINAGVRQALKAQGALGTAEQTFEVLEPKGWTRAMVKEAQYYRSGDVVRFGRDYRQLQVRKGEVWRVLSVDEAHRRVQLQADDGRLLAWQPARLSQVEVYQAYQRAAAEREWIRFTRNDGALRNGDVGQVAELRGGVAQVRLRSGLADQTVQVDLRTQRHWDHAYASTIHAAQGATARRTLMHIRAPESKGERSDQQALMRMAQVFGQRSFYVGATRASHEMTVFTNDKEMARRAVAQVQEKSSAVLSLSKERGGVARGM